MYRLWGPEKRWEPGFCCTEERCVSELSLWKQDPGWARRLMPAILALWEAEAQGDCLSPRVQDRPGQHGETLSLPNISEKLPGHCGAQLFSQLLRRLSQEDHLSLGVWVCSLQWAVIAPLYSNLGNSARSCLKKKKEKENRP